MSRCRTECSEERNGSDGYTSGGGYGARGGYGGYAEEGEAEAAEALEGQAQQQASEWPEPQDEDGPFSELSDRVSH